MANNNNLILNILTQTEKGEILALRNENPDHEDGDIPSICTCGASEGDEDLLLSELVNEWLNVPISFVCPTISHVSIRQGGDIDVFYCAKVSSPEYAKKGKWIKIY